MIAGGVLQFETARAAEIHPGQERVLGPLPEADFGDASGDEPKVVAFRSQCYSLTVYYSVGFGRVKVVVAIVQDQARSRIGQEGEGMGVHQGGEVGLSGVWFWMRKILLVNPTHTPRICAIINIRIESVCWMRLL